MQVICSSQTLSKSIAATRYIQQYADEQPYKVRILNDALGAVVAMRAGLSDETGAFCPTTAPPLAHSTEARRAHSSARGCICMVSVRSVFSVV